MGEKRRRKAFTSIRRKLKLRRKSVKVECKATHGKHTQNARHPARQRTVIARCTIRERKNVASYPIGIQQKKIAAAYTEFGCRLTPTGICAPSTKKLCAIWEVSELTFAAIERIIASWRRERKSTGGREEETGWRQKSFVHLQYFWTWMAP